MKTTFMVILLITLTILSFAQTEIGVLEGKWKREGKEAYEVWEAAENGLTGYGYRMKDGEKVIFERFEIKMIDENWVYGATVPDQNEGATIPFTLNKEVTNMLSFENPNQFETLLKAFPKSPLFVSNCDSNTFELSPSQRDINSALELEIA